MPHQGLKPRPDVPAASKGGVSTTRRPSASALPRCDQVSLKCSRVPGHLSSSTFGSHSNRGLQHPSRAIKSANTARRFSTINGNAHLQDLPTASQSDLPERQLRSAKHLGEPHAPSQATGAGTSPLMARKKNKLSTPDAHAELQLLTPSIDADSWQSRIPNADRTLNTDDTASALSKISFQLRTPLQLDVKYSPDDTVLTLAQKAALNVESLWKCSMEVRIANSGTETSSGRGTSKVTARQAAWRSLLGEWLSSGRFDNLHSSTKPAKPGKENESEKPDSDFGAVSNTPPSKTTANGPGTKKSKSAPLVLQDFHHWKGKLEFPNKNLYPLARKDLFEHKSVIVGVQNLCQRASLPLEIDANYTQLKSANKIVHHCDLTIKAGTECTESISADGPTKQDAKLTAFLCVVAKLHMSGKLDQIHSMLDKPVKPQPSTAKDKQSKVNRADSAMAVIQDSPLVPAKVDKATMQSEKDAKLEIYDYFARFGLMPKFDAEVIDWKRKGLKKKLVRVTIASENGKVSASAVAEKLRFAEIAAAVAFKHEAERQHGTEFQATAPLTFLTSDTAKGFIEYYRARKEQPSVELETEIISVLGENQHSARLIVDGAPLANEAIYMKTKKEAEVVATLTAAIGLSRLEPTILRSFRGDGRKLGFVDTIQLNISNETYGVMRDGLLEARNAGLCDERHILHAELPIEESSFRRSRRALTKRQAAFRSEELSKAQEIFTNDASLAQLRESKAALPINLQRRELQTLVASNPYAIVIGATGSGKSTQMPQILLEEAIAAGRGGQCNVVCTQPRRIAATSVAARVAAERNERLQQSVGYHVRFDKKIGQPGGSITYCTTGILLEQIKFDPEGTLGSISHLIIDEVHERDLNIDFLMATLKTALEARRASGLLVPRVVLMSATLDPELFAKYFATPDSSGAMIPCPYVKVPGRTFPVKEQYLGDIMHDLLHNDRGQMKSLVTDFQGSKELKEWLASETEFSKGYVDQTDRPVIDWKRQHVEEHGQSTKAKNLAEAQEKYVPVSLLATLIGKLCSGPGTGAILAFLPGVDDIMATDRSLRELRPFDHDFTDSSKFKVCILHSLIPKEDQAAAFEIMPPGCRKIILATNIAETSVTVSDVTHVIDAGRLREMRYDQLRRISQLQTVWESKSNGKQRAGRAGRVQNGNYYALFSKERHQSMRSVPIPEILRADLSHTALSIKANFAGEAVQDFLSRTIEPPSSAAVESAVAGLKNIEALTADEGLTDLGRVLSKLPVHPSLGKMVILGVIFRCLDPLLIISAASEERKLFVTPLGRRSQARAKHRIYADEQSDHLGTIKAFQALRALDSNRGFGAASQHAAESFLHMGAFRSIAQSAQQIEKLLAECGLISSNRTVARVNGQYGPPDLNRNSGNTVLVKSLLLAGLSPNLAVKSMNKGLGYRTINERFSVLDSGSVNVSSESRKRQDVHPKGTVFAYSSLHQLTAQMLYIRDTTQVTPLMSVLFGGKLALVQNDQLEQDEWLRFGVTGSGADMSAKMVLEFRKAVDRMLNGAFRSLSKLESSGQSAFMDDPARDILVNSVIAALDGLDVGLSKKGGPFRFRIQRQ